MTPTMVPLVCDNCDKQFERELTHVKKGAKRSFCSKRCMGEYNVKVGRIGAKGAKNNRYNHGYSKDKDGRRLIMVKSEKGGYMYYSRWLMEKHLGRELTFDEVVHHINGDKLDDRIENLEVLTRAEHMEVHRGEIYAARGIAA